MQSAVDLAHVMVYVLVVVSVASLAAMSVDVMVGHLGPSLVAE